MSERWAWEREGRGGEFADEDAPSEHLLEPAPERIFARPQPRQLSPTSAGSVSDGPGTGGGTGSASVRVRPQGAWQSAGLAQRLQEEGLAERPGRLRPCGAWGCLLEEAEGGAEGEAGSWECELCGDWLRERGRLACVRCPHAACVLCWLRLAGARVKDGRVETAPACPFCRAEVPNVRLVQLGDLHARHRDQLPFRLPVLRQSLRLGDQWRPHLRGSVSDGPLHAGFVYYQERLAVVPDGYLSAHDPEGQTFPLGVDSLSFMDQVVYPVVSAHVRESWSCGSAAGSEGHSRPPSPSRAAWLGEGELVFPPPRPLLSRRLWPASQRSHLFLLPREIPSTWA